MSDMRSAIVPKSDQLNADDLIAGPITIKITGVTIKSGEQPVSIHFEDDNGKPYKCCKSMARILVSAWGADSKKYVGRSLTLYRDPAVKWAGLEVGGIRISHMSDIADDMTMALTVTRANKKPFTVRPIKAGKESAPPAVSSSIGTTTRNQAEQQDGADQYITPDQVVILETLCGEVGTTTAKLKAAAKVDRLSLILAADFQKARDWLDRVRDARAAA